MQIGNSKLEIYFPFFAVTLHFAISNLQFSISIFHSLIEKCKLEILNWKFIFLSLL